MLKIAVLCGGISEERGISLNSARSFLDHTHLFDLHITLIYVNPEGKYYSLTPSHIYSNTPSDFDFKLARLSKELSEEEFVSLVKKVDLVLPLIHGLFGEDGSLQKLLEKHHIPYVGSSSAACRTLFNKYTMHTYCKAEGLPTLPTLLVTSRNAPIEDFWNQHCVNRAVVKPSQSGSSIGVTYVTSLVEAQTAIDHLLSKGFKELLLETYSDGKEFTLCVLQNKKQSPVALIPLEISINHSENTLLSFRRKYLPTEETRHYCPPRFSEEIIKAIRQRGEWLFEKLHLQDFVRMDGWVTHQGEIVFFDFNPVSGMEQNSFLFQQAARSGLTHADLIEYLLSSALARYQIQKPLRRIASKKGPAQKVYVLMGGSTAERQTSLMSGTNVFLKLKQELHYEPTPFLLDPHNDVWELPYSYILHHTVEEVEHHCRLPFIQQHKDLQDLIRTELELPLLTTWDQPIKMSFEQFCKKALAEHAFVFLGLHGGFGEDGRIQKLLEEQHLVFNGSDTSASALCMDKHATALKVASLNDPDILPMKQLLFQLNSLKTTQDIQALWKEAITTFQTEDLLIKPRADGCSAGVFRLPSYDAFVAYLKAIQNHAHTFQYEQVTLDMPIGVTDFLLEPFIHTDKISVSGTHLHHIPSSGWYEMTIGLLEKQGVYHALSPSITIAEKDVLSIEEKFQGGTGINLTPPPEEFLSLPLQKKVKESVCRVGKVLGIRNYARLDLFVHGTTGVIQVIEANTLPALTPSTVFFHQALCETPPIAPRQLLSLIIENAYASVTSSLPGTS